MKKDNFDGNWCIPNDNIVAWVDDGVRQTANNSHYYYYV